MVGKFLAISNRSVDSVVSKLSAVAWILLLVTSLSTNSASGQLRPEWTSGRITGSPEPPPPFRQVRRFPHLEFDQPLAIEKDPANERLWVVTRKAQIYSFPDDDKVNSADLFVDLNAEFPDLIPLENSTRVGSAFCIAFHPKYPEVPYCWITYTLKMQHGRDHHDQGSRLSRFRIEFEDGVPACDVKSERVVLSWLEGGHNGGAIRFGPDGYLYVSAGDGEVPNPPDPRRAGQDVTNQLSTILRIDVSISEEGPTYTVPEDNPFANAETLDVRVSASDTLTSDTRGSASAARDFTAAEAMPEIWAYGFRNPWKMNFDDEGRLWVGDVGWELYEMVQNVAKGGNYGWSLFEGRQPLLSSGRRGPTPVLPSALVYHHSEGASVTGGLVYRGTKFPELKNQYIFGDYETRRIWASKIIDAQIPHDATLAGLTDLVEPSLRIVAFGEDTRNELLLIHMDEGTLYGLQENELTESGPSFPQRLSETGLFDDVRAQKPATGVIPFEIIEPLFTGATIAERWIALSGQIPGQVLEKGTRRDNSPLRDRIVVETDSVAVRTVHKTDISGRTINVETQILHFNGKVWNPYSYAWNADQTDARLVPASGAIIDLAAYGKFSNSEPYRIHSRSECIRCHNSWAGGLLAFSLPQLNRPVLKASSKSTNLSSGDVGSSINQIDLFRQMGLLAGAIPDDPATTERPHCRALVASRDSIAEVDLRVRSYLDVNCAHCHQKGAGGTATIDLRFRATPEEAKLIGATPMQGTFEIADAKIVAAGVPEQSVLLYRMACEGRGHMPHMGSDGVDGDAVKLVTRWVLSMGRVDVSNRPSSLTSTTAALQIMQKLDAGKINKAERNAVLKEAREAAPEIRNLFARFQPQQYRTRRRILDARAILSLNGDPIAGEIVFRNTSLQCATCHQVAGKGGGVGPALDKRTVSQQTAAQLLESILKPSDKVAEEFAAWTLVTTAGKVTTGLLKERSEESVTLVNSKRESFTFARDEIDELVKQEVSLMPDRLVESLTDQQIADLVAWLRNQSTP